MRALIVFLLLASTAMAADVTLKWDANNPAPEGYRVLMREADGSYDYNNPSWQGPETQCTLSGLTEGTTYFFVVRAYDGVLESASSQEVEYPVPTTGIDIPKGVYVHKVIIININP